MVMNDWLIDCLIGSKSRVVSRTTATRASTMSFKTKAKPKTAEKERKGKYETRQ